MQSLQIVSFLGFVCQFVSIVVGVFTFCKELNFPTLSDLTQNCTKKIFPLPFSLTSSSAGELKKLKSPKILAYANINSIQEL
jgi:hypothetical protein